MQKKYEIILFILFWGIFIYFLPTDAGWNVNSRLALTYSLLDTGSFAIDDYCTSKDLYTEDVAWWNGHYYTDKIIGTSFVGLPAYGAVRLFSFISGKELTWLSKRYFVTSLSVSLLAAASAILLFRILLIMKISILYSTLISFFYSIGTLIFAYSFLFMPYAPANFFILLSLYLIKKHSSGYKEDEIPLFQIGLSLGMAMFCEYTYALAVIGVIIYLLFTIPEKKYISQTIIGAAIPLIIFAAYLLICFHKILLPYHLEKNPVFQIGMSRGLAGIAFPRLSVLFYITFHPYRGLFFYSPFLIIGIIGILVKVFSKYHANQNLHSIKDSILALWVFISFLWLNSSYYMWWGGWTNGPRFLIPVIPFLTLEAAIFTYKNSNIKIILIILGFISIIMNFIPAAVDPQTPQGYKQDAVELLQPSLKHELKSPILIWQFPKFFEGNLGLNLGNYLFNLKGMSSLIPLLIWSIIGISALSIQNKYIKKGATNCDPMSG